MTAKSTDVFIFVSPPFVSGLLSPKPMRVPLDEMVFGCAVKRDENVFTYLENG
jgi:hypothetical protein